MREAKLRVKNKIFKCFDAKLCLALFASLRSAIFSFIQAEDLRKGRNIERKRVVNSYSNAKGECKVQRDFKKITSSDGLKISNLFA